MRNEARVRGEREYTRARAGPDSRGRVRAREQKRAVGRLRQARSVGAVVSCLRGVREVVGEEEDVLGGVGRAGVRVRARALCVAKCWVMGEARESSPVVDSGGERQAIAEAASPM